MKRPHAGPSAAAALFVCVFTAGCAVEAGGPEPVAVEPGYYYDDEYVDVGGYRHPREYWYHDGHAWAHRDGVPHGYAARSRAGVGYGHDSVPHAAGGGGFHGGGGGGTSHGGGGHGGR